MSAVERKSSETTLESRRSRAPDFGDRALYWEGFDDQRLDTLF